MTKAELTRRLAPMSPGLILKVAQMIQDGYSAHGITRESTATLKQTNAVFQASRSPEWVAALQAARAANESQNGGGRTFALSNLVNL